MKNGIHIVLVSIVRIVLFVGVIAGVVGYAIGALMWS